MLSAQVADLLFQVLTLNVFNVLLFKIVKLTVFLYLSLVCAQLLIFSKTGARAPTSAERIPLLAWRAMQFGRMVWIRIMIIFRWPENGSIKNNYEKEKQLVWRHWSHNSDVIMWMFVFHHISHMTLGLLGDGLLLFK